MNSNGILLLHEALASSLRPAKLLPVSQWARDNFYLSSEYSATVGKFNPYPYQIEPLDMLGPSNQHDTMVLMCGAQMMKTVLMMILLGYVIDTDPGPVLIVQPSGEDARAFSRERIAPMIADNEVLRAKVVEAKSRESGNTIAQKRFIGGNVSITGSISPLGLRRRSIRYLLLDEVDAYEASSDGDPIALASARTAEYPNRRIVMSSTPTTDGISRIAIAYANSDQRVYLVPCPSCGRRQELTWSGVRWGDVDGQSIDPKNAVYQCCECRVLIRHEKKMEMLRAGGWVVTNPEGAYPGYRISRLYSPSWSWGRVVTDPIDGWLAAQGDAAKLRAFANNVLGEVWREKGDQPDWERLQSRCEHWNRGTAPAQVLFITAGVDVQKDRLVCDWWGWGRGKQRWLLDRDVVEGDTSREEVWTRLTALIGRTFRHENGCDMGAAKIGIDSGYAAAEVYAWARRQGPARVMVIKGNDTGVALLGQPTAAEVNKRGKYHKAGVRVWPMNASMGKSELYGQLNQPRPEAGEAWPAGWIHLPDWVSDEWLKELTAEQFSFRMVKGWKKGFWEKVRERNEAIDCANIARAVASHVGLDRFNDGQWRAFETTIGRPQAPAAAPPPAPQPKPVPQSEQTGLRLDRSGRDWIAPRKSWL